MERVVGLVFVDIECRSSDSAVFERRGEGRLVDECPPGGVDEEGPGPHLFYCVLVNEVVVVFVEGTV